MLHHTRSFVIFLTAILVFSVSVTSAGVSIDPNNFNLQLNQGCTAARTLTINNIGATDLNFTVRSHIVSQGAGAVQVTGHTTASQTNTVLASHKDNGLSATGNHPYKKDTLLVRFANKADKKPRTRKEKDQILASLNAGSVDHEFKIVPGLSVVKLPPGLSVEDAIKKLKNRGDILYAEPDYEVKALSTIPNDSRFGELWGMHNTGQSGGTPGADIHAPDAWDIATGSTDIVVAVIDTGVDYTHPDLAANIWVNPGEIPGNGIDDDHNGYIDDVHGYDFVNNDGDPMDDFSPIYHGTHVSGTIGGIGNNGQGVAGVNWHVKIMAIKFLSSAGSGSTANAIKAVEYSVLMHAKLSSNSWGGGPYSQALEDAINAAGDAGMLFVAAAGNDYGNNNDINPVYPVSYGCDSIVGVMATDKNDNMSSFSNYGPTSVDIGAPGSDVLSCMAGNQYQYLSGTSMATPHVAGACALLWSMNPQMSNMEVKNTLMQSVDNTLPGLCASGGRLNLYNAILKSKAPWLTIVPETGTIPPGGSFNLSVTFNAMDLTPAAYNAEIDIYSNDPLSPAVVPATMTVVADDLVVTPTTGFEPNGMEGGPFTPACTTYTLTNNGTNDVHWTAAKSESWFSVEPNEGQLTPGATINVNVCLSPDAAPLDPNIYTATLTFQNTDSGSIKPRTIKLTVKPPDCFTELFEAGSNDVNGLTLTFSPNGTRSYYEACRSEKTSVFPTDPNGGTYVSLWDDDFAQVNLTNGANILFYGTMYDSFFIGSNGYITFGQGDTESAGTLENHFKLPRISGLFADLNPPNGHCISYKQLDDRIAVTFKDVPLLSDKTAKHSFQIELFFVDGTVRITWLNLSNSAGVAGLSKGRGLPPTFFIQSDLSKYNPCCPQGDFDKNYSVNFKDFAILAANWLNEGCGIPLWCGKTDLDFTGIVETADLGIFADNWLVKKDWLQPIAHWKLDEGTGTIAHDSAGHNDGTIYGATWTSGQIGGALSFDGVNNYVEVPDNVSLRPSYITMSAWIKPQDITGYMTVIGKSNYVGSYNEQYSISLSPSGIAGSYIKRNSDCSPGIGWYGALSQTALQGGQWYMITGTWDGNIQKIYVNGVLESSATAPAGPIDNCSGGTLRIGLWWANHWQWYHGIIDDVRIYDKALTIEEVMELYQSGLSQKASIPNPPDGVSGINPNTVLSWSAGRNAISHNVYLGTSFSDVNDSSTPTATTNTNNYDPCDVSLGTTYYWRIDEYDGTQIYKGDVWSFTTRSTIDPNLVGWWTFDETSGTTASDSSGHNNNGTLNGNPVWITGQIGGALSFDGNGDYVNIPDDPTLRFNQDSSFTMSFWAKPLSTTTGGYVICKMRSTGEQGIFGYELVWGPSVFGFYIESSGFGSTKIYTFDNSAPANNWYFATMVYDKKNMKIYLNGQLHNTGTFDYDTGNTTPDKALAVGARSYDTTVTSYFTGIVDDVRIYNRALSAAEVLALYQGNL